MGAHTQVGRGTHTTTICGRSTVSPPMALNVSWSEFIVLMRSLRELPSAAIVSASAPRRGWSFQEMKNGEGWSPQRRRGAGVRCAERCSVTRAVCLSVCQARQATVKSKSARRRTTSTTGKALASLARTVHRWRCPGSILKRWKGPACLSSPRRNRCSCSLAFPRHVTTQAQHKPKARWDTMRERYGVQQRGLVHKATDAGGRCGLGCERAREAEGNLCEEGRRLVLQLLLDAYDS